MIVINSRSRGFKGKRDLFQNGLFVNVRPEVTFASVADGPVVSLYWCSTPSVQPGPVCGGRDIIICVPNRLRIGYLSFL